MIFEDSTHLDFHAARVGKLILVSSIAHPEIQFTVKPKVPNWKSTDSRKECLVAVQYWNLLERLKYGRAIIDAPGLLTWLYQRREKQQMANTKKKTKTKKTSKKKN